MMHRNNSKVGIRNIQNSGQGFRGESVAANGAGRTVAMPPLAECHPDMTGREIIEDALKDGLGTS
jgi:hypothetical protein